MSEPIRCPDCRVPMRDVSARARTGYLLALDQCSRCGGIWFDRWELFPLHHAEVSRLDSVDTALLDRAVEERHLGDCPRCEVGLRPFRDPNLPEDARVARCHVCEGMWLQRGQLAVVKRSAVENAKPASVEDPELRAMVELYGHQADWSRVRHLDSATYETEEPLPELGLGGMLAASLPVFILSALFRLLMRR